MSMKTREKSELQPYRVVKDGRITSDHKFAGQAIDEAKKTGGDSVFYLNYRDFGTTVWNKDWAAEDAERQGTKIGSEVIDTGGYL
jgi:hypothetical protein